MVLQTHPPSECCTTVDVGQPDYNTRELERLTAFVLTYHGLVKRRGRGQRGGRGKRSCLLARVCRTSIYPSLVLECIPSDTSLPKPHTIAPQSLLPDHEAPEKQQSM